MPNDSAKPTDAPSPALQEDDLLSLCLTNRLFEGITGEEIVEFDPRITFETYEEGEIIFEEGAIGDELYLIFSGTIKISKKGRGGRQETLAHLKEGTFFGEMAILDGEGRSARATAHTAVRIGRMARDEFDRYLSHSPRTARTFFRVIVGQLRRANTHLIDELINAERLSLIGSMMGGIVHDFKNPLATISMIADYLSVDQDRQDLRDLGEQARSSVKLMLNMMQELLDFSRGTSRLHVAETTMANVLEIVDKQFLQRLGGGPVKIEREIGFDGTIEVDRDRIIRLLLNILNNAVDAMARGGTLTIRTAEQGENFLIEIEDTGKGIPPEILERIYEPFVTHGKSGGTGLGMAIAKSVVDAHGGRISIDSTVGEGTTCRIELPRHQ